MMPLKSDSRCVTAAPCVSENALMMFGSESEQQPTPGASSTVGPSVSSRENRSTTSPQETIETMRNSLDGIIPTQVDTLIALSDRSRKDWNSYKATVSKFYVMCEGFLFDSTHLCLWGVKIAVKAGAVSAFAPGFFFCFAKVFIFSSPPFSEFMNECEG